MSPRRPVVNRASGGRRGVHPRSPREAGRRRHRTRASLPPPRRAGEGTPRYDSTAKQKRLVPEWQDDARARHPYAGKVYVSLHPASDYGALTGPMDVVALTKAKKIEVPDDIVGEREASFPGWIEQDRVVAEHIARYPSFKTACKKVYGEKYGLSRGEYESFQAVFLRASSNRAREELLESLGEWLVRYHEARLVELARRLAHEQQKILVYRGADGLLTYRLPVLQTRSHSGARSSARRPSSNALDGGYDEESEPQPRELWFLDTVELPHDPVPLIGILNGGNGCYVNSVLQLLRTVGGAVVLGAPPEEWNHQPTAAETIAFMDQLGSDAANGTYCTKAGGQYTSRANYAIRQLLKTRGQWNYLYAQQDAMEAMQLILGAFSREFKDAEPAALALLVDSHGYDAKKPSPLHFLLKVRAYYDVENAESVHERAGGEWYELDQAHSRSQYHDVVHISLPLAPGGEATTLDAIWQAAWDRKYDPNEADTAVNCYRGEQNYRNARRSRDVTTFAGEPPAHLILQIYRFTAGLEKITRVVDVPEQYDGFGCQHRLQSFIYHDGDTMHGGHYIAYVRVDGTWYEANDNLITPNPGNLQERRNLGYLYYYHRV